MYAKVLKFISNPRVYGLWQGRKYIKSIFPSNFFVFSFLFVAALHYMFHVVIFFMNSNICCRQKKTGEIVLRKRYIPDANQRWKKRNHTFEKRESIIKLSTEKVRKKLNYSQAGKYLSREVVRPFLPFAFFILFLPFFCNPSTQTKKTNNCLEP